MSFILLRFISIFFRLCNLNQIMRNFNGLFVLGVSRWDLLIPYVLQSQHFYLAICTYCTFIDCYFDGL